MNRWSVDDFGYFTHIIWIYEQHVWPLHHLVFQDQDPIKITSQNDRATGAFLLSAGWRSYFQIRCSSWTLKTVSDLTCHVPRHAEAREEISGYYAQFFFLLLKKTKQNITLATIWLLAFFLCCSFNPDWFLKTREMFSEWKDKSLTPLCWEFIFQLCYTRIALGWIRYLMALVLKTQWTVCFWRNGQFSIDTCRARIARPNAVWSSESGAATPLRRGRREASSQESVKRIVTVLWRGGR